MIWNQCDIGLIGLAVMGENLVLNMDSKGFSVAVFNRTTEVTDKFAAGRAKDKKIQPTRTIEEFVGALTSPRKAMIMVKAGAPVDAVIQQIAPLLEKGDVIIDGGNSLFTDTQRRGKNWRARESILWAWAFLGARKVPSKAPPSCRAGRASHGRSSPRFSERSLRKWMASRAAVTWGRMALVITSRWSTTASSTGISN